jgi:hypothetical protein
MRRFFTLVCLLCLAIPAGISISGCTRNPSANYCNGKGYGPKITDVASIDLEPRTTGISMSFGQTRQVGTPTAKTCMPNQSASVSSYTYGTTNNLLVDISPSGNICAGRWNRNSGGGIADYTTCNKPSPLPTTNGLPYSTAYITASADAVTSNPVEVYIHADVTSVTLALAGAQDCYTQGKSAQLDAEACYSNGTTQLELCAPSTVSKYACALPSGITSVPSCSAAIGTLNYSVGTAAVATINSDTNLLTAAQPGTTVITASVAGSGSSAGYFSTCPPKSIAVTLNNGTGATTPITVTKGVTQNLTTTVVDTKDQIITGLSLEYQSTDPIDISAVSTGAVTASYPGQAAIYAVCQPPTCNPTPINQVGLYGTGLPVSSNPVNIVTPGTASNFVWFSSPGQSQYFVPVELLKGSIGSTVRLPYVPNSMVMDRLGTNLYFGSSHELMIYATDTNALSKEITGVPGVVLAVSPDNSEVLVNDQARQLFYIYSVAGNSATTYGGLGNAAAWTPDSKTLYITGTDTTTGKPALFVYSQASGWTSHDLSASGNAESLAITVPSVGAYLSGASTVAHTWCPTGTVSASGSTITDFYPLVDTVAAQTDVLAATTDGQHILGAAMIGGGVTLSDIGVTIPSGQCPAAVSNVLQPLTLTHTLIPPVQLSKVNATAVNQVVTSPASNLAFVTYTGTTPGALLPYYKPVTSGAGTVDYVTLMNGSSASTTVTAPLAGAFSPDDKLFFVSTAGDNQIHYIDVTTLKDTQQITPNLPGCILGGTDSGCTLPSASTYVPATAIAVKPRTTT